MPRSRAPGSPSPSAGPHANAHVVSDAASATEATGTDTTPSSDWLAELQPAAPPPQPGVAISTRPRQPVKGRAVESKRGQRT